MGEANIAQKLPIVIDVEPGTYWWCACGLSKGQPYCDGSHKVTEFTPIEVKIENKRRVAWCACKQSNKRPFCDGTHRTL